MSTHKDKDDDTGTQGEPVELDSHEFKSMSMDMSIPISAPSREFHKVEVTNASPLPWVLFVVALLIGLAASLYLYRQQAPLGAELAESQKARTTAETSLAELQKEHAELLVLKKELAEDVAAKDAELARLKKTHDALAEKMKGEIDTGDIRLTQDGSRLTVDLVDKVLFDSGQAEVSPRGQEVLTRVGAVLAQVDDRMFTVMGHTDDSPPTEKIKAQFPTNWELSAARATNVVRFLQDTAKVPGKRMVASGRGQYQPVATNANHRGRARNRRIEILLTPLVVGEKGRGSGHR